MHKSHTTGLFTPPCLRWENRMMNGYCCVLSWSATKVNINIETANEREGKGGDLYLHVFVLSVVLARCIQINIRFKLA